MATYFSNQDLGQSQDHIRQAWEAFVAGKDVHSYAIAPHILSGWEYSRQCKIDPFTPQIPPVLSAQKLQKIYHEHRDLLDSAEPMLKMLEVSIHNTGYIATLAIASGCLLAVVGDDTLLKRGEEVYNVPGAMRSADNVGTSAITLCMKLCKPLEIIGYEHYNKLFHDWKCAAAPIFSSQAEPIGSLSISGNIWSKEHHILALVKSCAEVITIRLREKELLRTQKRLNSMLESMYNSLPEAVIALSESGKITHLNYNAKVLLAGTSGDLEGGYIQDILLEADLAKLKATLQQCKPDIHELVFKFGNDKQDFLCRFTPIFLDQEKTGGMILAITDQSQLINMVTHVSGNHAKYQFKDIKGNNQMLGVQLDLAKRAAATNSRVLLSGESGTGKELFAQAIHNASSVRKGPFVAISCATIPRDLVESELFGYVGGTFTGSRRQGMIGKFELASGGSLFLDEINSLPLEMQAKLLRALQQKEIIRIGDTKPTSIDARIISATNVDLLELVKYGAFREDLYYRLNVVEIYIPALRDRRDDLDMLAHLFLTRQSAETKLAFCGIDTQVLKVFHAYPWPGNVRELDNVCERALIMAGGKQILLEHLPKPLQEFAKSKTLTQHKQSEPKSLDTAYQKLLQDTLRNAQGNLSLAASQLGIARTTLYRRLRKYNLSPE